jgi:hypothetical protein
MNSGERKVRIFHVADAIYWGDDTLKPFGASEKRLGSAHGTPRGFQHPLLDTESPLTIVKAIGGFTYISAGGVEGMPPVSYGVCSPTEYAKHKLLWAVNDRLVSAIGTFTGEFNRTSDLLKTPFFGIPPGGQFVYERVMAVGGRNDAASATDTLLRLLGKTDGNAGVTGKVEPSNADTSVLIVTEGDELPVTEIRPLREGERAGVAQCLLPPGKYVAKIRSVERDPDLKTPQLEPITRNFTVSDGRFADFGTVQLPRQSTLAIEVFDGLRHLPARLIICGAQGTPDPELGTDLLGFTVDGKLAPSTYRANWLLLGGNETGPVRVGLRPGKYIVYATHGFEYSVAQKEVDLSAPGSETSIALSLERVIDGRGMVSGDFHVHSAPSMDSAVSLEQRALSLVADGVDVLIATDHDQLTDFAPIVSMMNLSDRITSIIGVEATSMLQMRPTPFTIGHYNAWPLRYNPSLPRHGMPLDEGVRPRDLFDRLRQVAAGDSLIQVNHGRSGTPDGEASYFNALGLDFKKPLAYNPAKALTDSPNSLLLAANANGTRDIDFDAMELLNGSSYSEYLLLRADWFSLLNQGCLKTGTANSDTHTKANLGGYPRNYIMLDDPEAERADAKQLVGQIRKRKVMGTTGPVIKLDVNAQAGIGDTITVNDRNVNLNIKALAAPWVPLDEVRVFANGARIETFKIGPETNVVRLDRSVPKPLEKDAWLVVEATTSNRRKSQIPEPPGGLYNIIAPGFVPLAFTNPIFVDVDGNGRYDPPGMPSVVEASEPPWRVKASIVATFLATAFVVGYIRRKRAAS